MAREEIITISSVGGSGPPVAIDRATAYEITRDLTAPFEANIEMGDGGTFEALREALSIGRRFTISLNGSPLITGRMLSRGSPISSGSGATVTLSIRTRMSDAQFSSCTPFSLRKATLKDAVLKAYATIGMTEADFIFDADVARDLFTGKGGGGSALVDLAKLSEDDARIRPPETVYEFVDRHLRRFELMHWDSPDGRIVVGKPDDTRPPTYSFRLLRSGAGNNLLSPSRTEDYEGIPSALAVYGQGGGRDYRRARVQGVVTDPLLMGLSQTLPRPTMVIDESVLTMAQAMSRARREILQRSLNRDSWELPVAGFTERRDGASTGVPFAPDTTCDLRVDTVGPASAVYYCWRVTHRGSADTGHTSQLTVVQRGIWVI
jgi:hypothetical protein